MSYYLNGFHVTFSTPTITVYVRDLPDPAELRPLRKELANDWFLHWRGGKLYGLPRSTFWSDTTFGEPSTIDCASHEALQLLAAKLNDSLPASFPQYDAFRHRPFAFLGQKDEIVAAITKPWANVPTLIKHFTIRPKYELDPRIIELCDEQTAIGLFMSVDTRWEIDAPLDELSASGVDLSGLHVIHRIQPPEGRRLVGRIERIDNGTIRLAESFDDIKTIQARDVCVEGSRQSFARCLRTILGSRYSDFEAARSQEEERFFTGPAIDLLLSRMEDVLRKASPIRITDGLECTIGDRINLKNSPEYSVVSECNPGEYCFDVAKAKRTQYAWPGLEKYGPYGRESFSAKTPNILVVTPDTTEGKVGQFIKLFRDGIVSVQNSKFASGFARTFGLTNPKFDVCRVPVLKSSNRQVAEAYRRAVEDYIASQHTRYDAAFVVLLDEHANLPDNANPYLWGKASLLMAGIPVQEAKLSTITAPAKGLQYTCQNLAIALYAKMGGVPWTMDHALTVSDEIVIGIGTAELSGSRFDSRQRHVGITTVFRGDGNYLLSHLSRECAFEEYAEVLQESTLGVLRDIKARNGWRDGDTVRIIFHAFKPFRNVEVGAIVDKCVREVGANQHVQFAFLTVSHDHPFKILDMSQAGVDSYYGKKAVYVPKRGLVSQLGRFTRLVATNGPYLIKRTGAPLPSPILVHLHPESDYRDQTYLAEQVVKFTSLSWRSTLPAREPVTIYYSSLIAHLLARLRAVPGWSPTVLNSRLRASKWFL